MVQYIKMIRYNTRYVVVARDNAEQKMGNGPKKLANKELAFQNEEKEKKSWRAEYCQ